MFMMRRGNFKSNVLSEKRECGVQCIDGSTALYREMDKSHT